MMKTLILCVSIFLTFHVSSEESFYQIKEKNIEGAEVAMSRYKDQVILVVNLASRCGYTSQLEGLESLYQKYQKRNFLVLGFPSNDFLGQTPEEDQDFKKFCKLKYGVTFPLFAKDKVKGRSKRPLYKYLTSVAKHGGDIKWNFDKFLISKDGAVIGRFGPGTNPDDQDLIKSIENALN